jgi:hypothetical protein
MPPAPNEEERPVWGHGARIFLLPIRDVNGVPRRDSSHLDVTGELDVATRPGDVVAIHLTREEMRARIPIAPTRTVKHGLTSRRRVVKDQSFGISLAVVSLSPEEQDRSRDARRPFPPFGVDTRRRRYNPPRRGVVDLDVRSLMRDLLKDDLRPVDSTGVGPRPVGIEFGDRSPLELSDIGVVGVWVADRALRPRKKRIRCGWKNLPPTRTEQLLIGGRQRSGRKDAEPGAAADRAGGSGLSGS